MKVSRILLGSFLVLMLAACGNDSPVDPTDPTTTTDPTDPTTTTDPSDPTTPDPTFPGLPTDPTAPTGSSISGTVTAPAGGDVSGTIVIACPGGVCDDPSTATVPVDTTGSYTFADLTGTQYGILAWKDVDGNQTVSNGDYLGGYSADGQTVTLVEPPATDINITLAVYDSGTGDPTTTDDPTDPTTGSGSISGTISAPTTTGATGVLACYYTGDDSSPCDDTLSSAIELAQPGAYSIDDLSPGQYLMAAFVDADGDGNPVGDADYIGFYPSLDAPDLVSPPASNINIQVEAPAATQVQTKNLSLNIREAARASLNDSFLKKSSTNFQGFLNK